LRPTSSPVTGQNSLRADAYDIVYCSWVFQTVDDLHACFAEAARMFRPGGAFVFAVPHPFYGTFDAEARELDWSYFECGPERNPIGEYDPDMLVWHTG